MRFEDLPEVLTVEHIARYLTCSDKHVYAMVQRGDLPKVQGLGRLVRVSKRALRDLLEGAQSA